MPSCMSKYRFVRVRISILMSKIISGNWGPLEADLEVQVPGTRYYFDIRIKILALTKLYLDIHEGFLCVTS